MTDLPVIAVDDLALIRGASNACSEAQERWNKLAGTARSWFKPTDVPLQLSPIHSRHIRETLQAGDAAVRACAEAAGGARGVG